MKINKGEVIIFPTDTVYGIGALAFDPIGQEKIYHIKARPKEKRLAVLCASLADIDAIAYVTEDARRLIEEFMPGGLTLILKTKPEAISESIHETVGVRIPNHPLALAILQVNGPMATTSVNKSGCEPLNDYALIEQEFGTSVLKVYPNSIDGSKVASTILDMTTNPYHVIREGDLKISQIMDFLYK